MAKRSSKDADDDVAAPLPRENPDLVGQGAAERVLLDAWLSGRLPHAWLIAGRPGVGKATLAYRFARFVLREGAGPRDAGLFGATAPDNLTTAADDPVFRRIASGGHADLLTIERQYDERRGRLRTEISVDQIRGIAAFMHLTAAEGGWRVVIVDALDALNHNAANALLKVLEEPPANALLLLIAHAPGAALATIRSRCRLLRLAPLDDTTLDGLLRRLRPELDGAARASLVGLAEGSAGRALDLIERGGLEVYRDMLALFRGAPRLDMDALYQLSERLARASGQEAYECFTDLYGWWLARLIRAGAKGAPISEAVAGEGAIGAALVERAGLDRLVEVWENSTHLFARADSLNLDRKQVVLNAFLALDRDSRR
ncbi:MAG: DNA polymerase III subunit delta' [Proteobacteria bacterium]|nr:DNA polymerase III subunit delta' [Pseudomonadota bacterium]